MSFFLICILLLAALLHASWNALLRAETDRFWSMNMMCVTIVLICGILTIIAPIPTRLSWQYIILSALLHLGYNLFLVRSYRSGDLGQTYPVARGSSPLLVTLGGAIFSGEGVPHWVSLTGIVLVSFGIISIAFHGRKLSLQTFFYALGTGVFIALYSVTDGIGGRLSGTPFGYMVWMGLLWGLMMPVIYILVRDVRSFIRGSKETLAAAGSGFISLLGYGIVVWAMSLAPLGAVAALRETSIVFAALIGHFFLREQLTFERILNCLVIAIGILLISNDH